MKRLIQWILSKISPYNPRFSFRELALVEANEPLDWEVRKRREEL